jgi:hypothetical protein
MDTEGSGLAAYSLDGAYLRVGGGEVQEHDKR